MDCARIDKWLWAARLFKTRSVAAAAVVAGRVHLNGMRAKPSKEVRVSDLVELTIGAVRRTLQVTGVSDRRGPASLATSIGAGSTRCALSNGEADRKPIDAAPPHDAPDCLSRLVGRDDYRNFVACLAPLTAFDGLTARGLPLTPATVPSLA